MDREQFCLFLEQTLIPDLIESGHYCTADDFKMAVEFMRNPDADYVTAFDSETVTRGGK